MDPLEEELRKTLRRQAPSDDFAARLASRISQEQTKRTSFWTSLIFPRWRWAAVAAVCIVMLGGWQYERTQSEGEAARQQVLLALRIAGTKMNLAQSKIQNMSQR